MTEEMSGGLRHHSDEACGPELCGWIQQSSKQDRYRLEPTSASAHEGQAMPQSYKNKVQYILTSPTSLEMLKNSFSLNWRKQNCSRMPYKRSSRIPRHFVSPKFWLFYAKREFFNTNAIFQQSTNCFVIFSAVDNRPIESADRLVVHCERGYSRRSAVMGWMLKARRAGM